MDLPDTVLTRSNTLGVAASTCSVCPQSVEFPCFMSQSLSMSQFQSRLSSQFLMHIMQPGWPNRCAQLKTNQTILGHWQSERTGGFRTSLKVWAAATQWRPAGCQRPSMGRDEMRAFMIVCTCRHAVNRSVYLSSMSTADVEFVVNRGEGGIEEGGTRPEQHRSFWCL